MSNQEILTKAIQKAIDGGWDVDPLEAEGYMVIISEFYGYRLANGFLLSHDFAKALWGEGARPVCLCDYEDWICDEVRHNTNAWQYHLQQMVIADDPIKYLGENIWVKNISAKLRVILVK